MSLFRPPSDLETLDGRFKVARSLGGRREAWASLLRQLQE